MWKSPVESDRLRLNMFGGYAEYGRAAAGSGQAVGTAPVMCRFVGVPGYPESWFVVRMSATELGRMLGGGTIPDRVRADCFEWLYRVANAG